MQYCRKFVERQNKNRITQKHSNRQDHRFYYLLRGLVMLLLREYGIVVISARIFWGPNVKSSTEEGVDISIHRADIFGVWYITAVPDMGV